MQDGAVRDLSASILDPYALDGPDRAELAATIESHLFDIVEQTDRLASLFAERYAARSRFERHVATHHACKDEPCLARAAMVARQTTLQRTIARVRRSIERHGR